MINAKFVHLFLNISNKEVSFPFYKEILNFLGYKTEYEDENQLGLNNGNTEIWIRPVDKNANLQFNRSNVGINHFAFRVSSREEIDQFSDLLMSKGIKTLYDSPRIFPEFTDDYYAVYFEDPEGIKIEVTSYTFEFQ